MSYRERFPISYLYDDESRFTISVVECPAAINRQRGRDYGAEPDAWWRIAGDVAARRERRVGPVARDTPVGDEAARWDQDLRGRP